MRWASSQTTRSHSFAFASVFRSGGLRASVSSLPISRSLSSNGLRSPESLSETGCIMLNSRLNFSLNSSCHCSTRLPGAITKHRSSAPLAISSFTSRPVMMVFPAPGSSASRKRSGCRGSISSYTAVIWWGSGWIRLEWIPA